MSALHDGRSLSELKPPRSGERKFPMTEYRRVLRLQTKSVILFRLNMLNISFKNLARTRRKKTNKNADTAHKPHCCTPAKKAVA